MTEALRQAAVAAKCQKAEEFALVAEFAFDGESYDAAVSLAVSAAINAGDALCVAHLGFFPSGQDHAQAPRVLRDAGFARASRQLGRALAVKWKAQYSSTRCTRNDAALALENAKRLINAVTALTTPPKGS